MSDTGPSGIDFDKADYKDGAAPTANCVVCNEPIGSTYYDVNGRMVDERCRLQIETELKTAGSGFQGLLLGAGAAVVGGIGWALITKAAKGAQWGIVAVAVGWLVGKAIAKGSAERATTPVRIAGVVFTYLAVVGQHISLAFEKSAGDGDVPFVVSLLLAVMMPFLQGVENIIGLLIIGFALWEAWSKSAPRQLVITGPFQLSSQRPAGTDVPA